MGFKVAFPDTSLGAQGPPIRFAKFGVPFLEVRIVISKDYRILGLIIF